MTEDDYRVVSPERILDQVEGATIAAYFIDYNDGLSICFRDGRTLVISGVFGVTIRERFSSKELH